MEFLVFVIAFYFVLRFIDWMNEEYADSKTYQQLKTIIVTALTLLMAIPLSGFLVALLVTEKMGMKTGGFMQGVVMLVSGFGLPLAVLWIVNSPK